MQDGCSIITVNVVDNCLLTHELQTFDAEEVRSLEKLHDVVQSDLTFICIEIRQHLNENVVADLLKSDTPCLVSLLMER